MIILILFLFKLSGIIVTDFLFVKLIMRGIIRGDDRKSRGWEYEKYPNGFSRLIPAEMLLTKDLRETGGGRSSWSSSSWYPLSFEYQQERPESSTQFMARSEQNVEQGNTYSQSYYLQIMSWKPVNIIIIISCILHSWCVFWFLFAKTSLWSSCDFLLISNSLMEMIWCEWRWGKKKKKKWISLELQ